MKYPNYIITHDGYIGAFGWLDRGGFPVYRFDRGSRIACDREIENGGQLTADRMCEIYQELNDKYYGPAVERDDTIRYEWARIPHFYNAFYVYKYATGYSAATAISHKILKEGKPAADRYIDFLRTGESDHPIELLKIAGVDMSSPEPIRDAMATFTSILDEFESLV